ncbi:hypothetical protein LEP1GSC192_0361 [Leptospira sp. B5-022]|nr:hypothetical protein LEP1GSC192_0361 [Leptospira sp. B5-022]
MISVFLACKIIIRYMRCFYRYSKLKSKTNLILERKYVNITKFV